ncbi:protein kinase domain-containing protein [Lactobacillus porci]|uniref:class III lanthionine synthetase LanKC N-terminal domain-containing protein n=1 Tax=Lactobacillus porci TaxID=2012477 RepID=UPI0039934935
MKYTLINDNCCVRQYNSVDIVPTNFDSSSGEIVSCDPQNVFLQINKTRCPLPCQGFKIHVSSTLQNYQVILDKVYDLSCKNDFTFKYISNYGLLEQYLGGTGSLWMTGKYITIYPENESRFKELIRKVYDLVGKEDGIPIFTDRAFRDSKNVYYRYGIINSDDDFIRDRHNTKLYRDHELRPYQLPPFVTEPFECKDEYRLEVIGKKYFPKGIISRKSSGGVYKAQDVHGRDVVIKRAKYGFKDSEESEIQKLQNEKENLEKWEKYDFIPKVLDSFYEQNDFFLVESYIKGVTIDDLRAEFIGDKRDNLYFDKIRRIVLNYLRCLQRLHNDAFFLGDISASNIIVDFESEKVFLVDVSQSASLTNMDESFYYRTQGFYDRRVDYLSSELQDVHQSGYLLMSIFSRANDFLKIDQSGKQSWNFFTKQAAEEKIPSMFIKVMKVLINATDSSLDRAIKILQKDDMKVLSQITTSQQLSLKSLLQGLQRPVAIEQIGKNGLDEKNSEDEVMKSLLTMELTNDSSPVPTFEQSQRKIFNELSQTRPSMERVLRQLFLIVEYLRERVSKVPVKFDSFDITIKKIESTFWVENDKFCGYRLFAKSKYISPYLKNGIAGMLLVFMNAKAIYQTEAYDKRIRQLVNELSRMAYAKNGTFIEGLSGITWSLIKYVEQTNDESCMPLIEKQMSFYQYYCVNCHGSMYLIDSKSEALDTSLFYGNRGMLLVLENWRKLYENRRTY